MTADRTDLLTQENIEKTIYRCFESYWNARMNKKYNVGRVSKIAAQDVMKLVEQENWGKIDGNVF